MKSFKLFFIFGFLIILVQLYTCLCYGNARSYYLECGQAIVEQDKRVHKKYAGAEKKSSFKYACSINILERYITIFMILYIMNFYIREKSYQGGK